MPPRRRLREAAGRLALLGAATLLGLLVAEVFLRVAVPRASPARADTANPYWVHDPTLGWRHRPDTAGRFTSGLFDVAVRINARGLRGGAVPPRPPAGLSRLLLVGDSFAWGWGVEEADVLATRLDEALAGWEVVNGATAGWSTDQELLWTLDDGLALHPDAVLLLFCDNDFQGNALSFKYGMDKPRFVEEAGALRLDHVPVPPPAPDERLRSWLKRHSALVRAGTIARHELLVRLDRGQGHGPQPATEEERRITRLLLERFAAEMEARGLPFLVALVPTRPDDAAWLRSVADALGVPFLDLGPAFERSLAQGRGPLQIEGDGHWNAEGHAVAARAMAPFLRAQLPAR